MKIFVSYSHRDEETLERLKTHLSPLRRDGRIETWYDREIRAGEEIDGQISAELEDCDIIILLISPDFLNSDYCMDREMARAMERHEQGTARVIPIIVEDCYWKSSPFRKLKALPKDGKPISNWTNENTAFLNIVEEVARVLDDMDQAPATSQPEFGRAPASVAQPRKYRVQRQFDEIDRSDFRDQAFDEIRRYFQDATAELDALEDLRGRFTDRSDKKFSCTVVNRTRMRGGTAHITVRCSTGGHVLGDISYVFAEDADDNTSNGCLNVEHDEYEMFLTAMMNFMSGNERDRMTPHQAAESLWAEFLAQAGVSLA
ncbi:toll/interleukin-1 receptor domain-containing protein [Halovulum dunhuangense]|uniref:Toll/interleukin-1 receptor domain-containing protein n=1 Tax=Halovulum dunhuangense TaxID=1505036 RepID=A0A849L2G8_9RHOB|nr:toll/interleukin-1 receptor domain-containing protein [Halovulum dunhuangense]NNU80538.1 toll/interleukin-1 receptor domain-containing protein [Halovulum dunhuangense]